MDITSLIGTLLSSDSISGVSKSAKSSNSDVTSVLSAALPLLLNGAKTQAEDESTAASFSKALATHGKKDTSDLSSFLGNVDLEDGSKIIAHLLGNDGDAIKTIAKQAGTNTKTASSVLSAAAPLMMSLLGQQEKENGEANDNNALGAVAAALIKNVDVGSLVTGLLTSGNTSNKKKTSAKKSNNNAELLGDILGSLLK